VAPKQYDRSRRWKDKMLVLEGIEELLAEIKKPQ